MTTTMTRPFDQLINQHDLMRALGSPIITGGGGVRSKLLNVYLPHPDDTSWSCGSWDSARAKAGHPGEWVRSNGHLGAWVPIEAAARATAMKLRWINKDHDGPGAKVTFSDPGRPCEVTCSRSEGMMTSFWTCARIATGTVTERDKATPACSMHQAHERRRHERDQQWAEESAARDAKYAHDDETNRRIAEVIDQVRPLLEQLGVHPDTIRAGRAQRGDALGVLIPAEVMELLTGKAVELETIKEDLGL